MKPTIHTSEVYSELRLFWPALAAGALGVYLANHFDMGWYWSVLIVIVAVVVGSAIHWQAIIEPTKGVVREEARRFGRRLIKERVHSIKDFGAIVFDLVDSDPEQWGVGIRHRSGRIIWIKRCGSAGGQRPPGRAAEEFAWRLSCDTGLEIEDYKPRKKIRIPVRAMLVWLAVLAGILLIVYFSNRPVSNSEVIIYAAQDQVYAEPILREFEKETGIKVKAVYDSEAVKTVGLANRLLAERSHPQCDVFWGNEEMRTRQLAAQNVFRVTNGWAAFGYRSRRIVINTNFVSERRALLGTNADARDSSRAMLGAPASLLELTNGIWRGKVALAFPQFGTTATHLHALKQLWGEERWLTWCRALAANKPFIVDGNSVVVKQVGRGEAWIGLTDSDDIFAGQREGLPIVALDGRARHSVRADVPPDGDGAHGVTRPTTDLMTETLLIPNTVAVIRNAPHPGRAQKLFEYLQRRDVAGKLVQASALESATAATETSTLKPNWDALMRDLEKTTKQLNEIFLR
jgi:iron(III) transport system substrate-binding protein